MSRRSLRENFLDVTTGYQTCFADTDSFLLQLGNLQLEPVHLRRLHRDHTSTRPFRAAPLVRVKAKFTGKNMVCCRRRHSHTEILTAILSLTRTSGAALNTPSYQLRVVYDGSRLLLQELRFKEAHMIARSKEVVDEGIHFRTLTRELCH